MGPIEQSFERREQSRQTRNLITVFVIVFLVSLAMISTAQAHLILHEAELAIQQAEQTRQQTDHTKPLATADFLAGKNYSRDRITKGELTPHATAQELLERLIDPSELTETNGVIIRDLPTMEARGYLSKDLPNQAWGDTSWPMYKGLIAQRYPVRDFRHAGPEWVHFNAYVNLPQNLFFTIAQGTGRPVDDLSPAEKYDLLIGDLGDSREGYLAPWMWRQGAKSQEKRGTVPHWYGFCHGSAPASFMFPRPAKYVDLMSADGRHKLRFYPSDIKALGTTSWANSNKKVRFIGRRCEVENPPRDSNGRIIDPNCFDINPGTWHMAVVNQLAGAHRNLIFDGTYDVQVWNRPLLSYEYVYFNPQTKRASNTFASSVIPLSQYTRDKYRAYRSNQVRQVVGITMKVRYLIGVSPDHSLTNTPAKDKVKEEIYVYDLEMGEAGSIIGGEWHQTVHPDFMWVPPKNLAPISDDEITPLWTPGEPVTDVMKFQAKRAALKGQPLLSIVDGLFKSATQP